MFICSLTAVLDGIDLNRLRRDYAETGRKYGVTGLFLAQGRQVVGLLEGPEAPLLACMEHIATSGMYSRLQVLREQNVAERRFANWSLCGLPESEQSGGMPTAFRQFAEMLSSRL